MIQAAWCLTPCDSQLVAVTFKTVSAWEDLTRQVLKLVVQACKCGSLSMGIPGEWVLYITSVGSVQGRCITLHN